MWDTLTLSAASLQPENLMVDVMNSSSRVRLIDFGDARNITNGYYVHPLVGSPEFASPELVNGSPVDLSADIWWVALELHSRFISCYEYQIVDAAILKGWKPAGLRFYSRMIGQLFAWMWLVNYSVDVNKVSSIF